MVRLVTIRGDLYQRSDGTCHAEFARPSGCHNCAKARGCGAGVLNQSSDPVIMHLSNSLSAGEGHVEATISAVGLATLTAAAYLLPALFGVLGAWCLTVALPAAGDAGALVGLAMGLVLAIGVNRIADIDSWARGCVKIRASSGARI